MIKTKYILIIFIPAILIAGIALFTRVIQYEPLYPDIEEYEEVQKEKGKLQIPIYPEDPILGYIKAPKTIIVFEDFGCEGCKSQFVTLEKLIAKHPKKIKIIWKGLPVTKFPHPSNLSHEYAHCANKQEKFEEYTQLAFTNSHNLSKEILDMIIEQIDLNEKKFNTCIESMEAKLHIMKTEQLGVLLNIQSVPTVFVDNKQIESPQYLESWESVLGL